MIGILEAGLFFRFGSVRFGSERLVALTGIEPVFQP